MFPYFIKKFEEASIVVKDYYKKGAKVPTMGGLVVIVIYLFFVSFFSLIGVQFNYIPVFILSVYAMYGLLDDLIKLRHTLKVIIPFFFSFPLIRIITDTTITFPFIGSFDLGNYYLYLIVPAYIMVTANLVNMHSGFNGLSAYTSLMIMASLLTISFTENTLDSVNFIIPLLGISLAFSYYNFYPSRIFEGNIGAMLGCSLGTVIILLKLEFIGFIMLIPHTVNFLMYVYYRITKGEWIKFGKVREDNTIEVPHPFKIHWVLPYYYRVNEEQCVLFAFIYTAVFCTIALIIRL